MGKGAALIIFLILSIFGCSLRNRCPDYRTHSYVCNEAPWEYNCDARHEEMLDEEN
jgi:hypothetical protein